jgi:hypothetical protein
VQRASLLGEAQQGLVEDIVLLRRGDGGVLRRRVEAERRQLPATP